MKLEVGMYCYHRIERWKGIGKIIKIDGDYIHIRFKSELVIYTKNNVVASHNIIDLIEVGDILVLDLWQYENSKQVVYETEGIKVVYMYDMSIPITNDEIVIKSILTKEQFSQMEYKVVE